jgi:hypothetical protein
MTILVVFFGGYNNKSSKTDMDLWLASARKQRNDVVFEAFPWPHGLNKSGDDDAVNGFKQFDDAIKIIEDSHADKIFIVGHSSGCAIANEVNSRLEGDHKDITLVDLDGFAPQHKQIKKSTVQAWYAVGGGGKSVNHALGRIKSTATQATQPWSLHFSLVNKAATDDITHENYKTEGYAGCIANLDFLDK